jgi:hypothetical protein
MAWLHDALKTFTPTTGYWTLSTATAVDANVIRAVDRLQRAFQLMTRTVKAVVRFKVAPSSEGLDTEVALVLA